MGLDLTEIYKITNDVKRNLFFEDQTLKLIDGNGDVLIEVLDGFYIPKNPTQNWAVGGEYFEGSISDPDNLYDLPRNLNLADSVQLGDEVYALQVLNVPRGSTKIWRLRLMATGQKNGL